MIILNPVATECLFGCIAIFLLVLSFRFRNARQAPILFFITVMLLHIFHLLANWNRLGTPSSDLGAILYIPKLILDGRLLYNDIFWHYGPIEPYFNALLYQLFGYHSNVLQIEAAILGLSISTLVYCLVLRHCSASTAFLASLFILSMLLTRDSHSFPYCFSTLYATLVSLLILLTIAHYKPTVSWMFLLGVLSGIGGLTKQNFGFLLFLGTILYITTDLLFLSPQQEKIPRKKVFTLLGTLIITTGMVTLTPLAILIALSDHPILFETIIPLNWGALYYQSIFKFMYSDTIRLFEYSTKEKILILSSFTCVLLWFIVSCKTILQAIKHKPFSQKEKMTFALFSIGCLLLLSVSCKAHLVVVLPVLTIGLCYAVGTRKRSEPSYRSYFATAGIILLSCSMLAWNFRWDNSKMHLLHSSHVNLYEMPIADSINEIAGIIQSKADPDDRLFVASAHSILYLLTGLDTPIRRIYMYVPGTLSMEMETQTIEELQATTPRFIVIQKDSYFGIHSFTEAGVHRYWNKTGLSLDQKLVWGRDFYQTTYQYIIDNYDMLHQNESLILYEYSNKHE